MKFCQYAMLSLPCNFIDSVLDLAPKDVCVFLV